MRHYVLWNKEGIHGEQYTFFVLIYLSIYQYISELAKHSFWNELWSLSYHSKQSWLLYPLHPIFNAILLSFWKNYVSTEFIDVIACRSSSNLPLDNLLSTSTDAVISRCRIEWPWGHTNLSVIVSVTGDNFSKSSSFFISSFQVTFRHSRYFRRYGHSCGIYVQFSSQGLFIIIPSVAKNNLVWSGGRV